MRTDTAQNQRCPVLLNTNSSMLDKIAEMPQIGIRASANMWRKPMTSVAAEIVANLRAGRPIVRKNMSVPQITAVLRMPTRDTAHIQWLIVPPLF